MSRWKHTYYSVWLFELVVRVITKIDGERAVLFVEEDTGLGRLRGTQHQEGERT